MASRCVHDHRAYKRFSFVVIFFQRLAVTYVITYYYELYTFYTWNDTGAYAIFVRQARSFFSRKRNLTDSPRVLLTFNSLIRDYTRYHGNVKGNVLVVREKLAQVASRRTNKGNMFQNIFEIAYRVVQITIFWTRS